jgi:hypothetical protein
MEAKEKSFAEKEVKTVDLVKGEFKNSEASHIVSALIDEKINFYKIQKWQLWESNHSCNTDDLDAKIKELESQKQFTKKWLNSQVLNGGKFKIEGNLQISLEA